MLNYVLRRLMVTVLLLVVTSFIVFALLHAAPGSPLEVLTGGRRLSDTTLQALSARYALDQPFLAQYSLWLTNVVQGDFGESIAARQSIGSLLASRAPVTLQLGLLASVIAIVFGVGAGTIAAMRRGRLPDTLVSGGVIGLAAVPAYLSGLLMILVFSVMLGWFPVFGAGEGVAGRLHHLVLPACALGFSLCALVARVTRATMVDVLGREFVEAARVRGMSERHVIGKHAIRNALGPIITVSGLAAGYLITGTVLVEVVFGINGLGSLLIQGVLGKDFAVVQAVAIVFTSIFLLITLLVDVLYFAVDPRTAVGVRTEA